MCAVSFIMDSYSEGWMKRLEEGKTVTGTDIEDFYRIYEKAKEYDKKTGQPDCELEEKRQRLLAIAKELGISITIH